MFTKRFKRRLNRIRQQGERYKKEKAIRDAYAEYWPEHKKRKTSNIMLAVSIIAIVGYVIADYILQYDPSGSMIRSLSGHYLWQRQYRQL